MACRDLRLPLRSRQAPPQSAVAPPPGCAAAAKTKMAAPNGRDPITRPNVLAVNVPMGSSMIATPLSCRPHHPDRAPSDPIVHDPVLRHQRCSGCRSPERAGIRFIDQRVTCDNRDIWPDRGRVVPSTSIASPDCPLTGTNRWPAGTTVPVPLAGHRAKRRHDGVARLGNTCPHLAVTRAASACRRPPETTISEQDPDIDDSDDRLDRTGSQLIAGRGHRMIVGQGNRWGGYRHRERSLDPGFPPRLSAWRDKTGQRREGFLSRHADETAPVHCHMACVEITPPAPVTTVSDRPPAVSPS